jgi:hypothetical protein
MEVQVMRTWFVMLGVFLLLAGCGSKNVTNGSAGGSPAAGQKPDVVDIHGKISNLERFHSFLENVEKGKADRIVIERRTTEGDPIYYDVTFDGKQFSFVYDNSQDQYAGSDKGRKETVCAKLEKNESDSGIEYVLSGCSQTDGIDRFLLTVPND